MDGLIGALTAVGGLLLAGGALGLADRRNFSPGWLLTAGALFLLNDALLTNLYGNLPGLLPGSDWNWQGKGLALIATLIVASLPAFGWGRSGLTLRQNPGSIGICLVVAAVYGLFLIGLALAFPNQPPSAETVAFQLTMPSLEEEPFFRGILLLALCEAFRGRWRVLGVDWSWGALLSCALFGLMHAFGYSDGAFSFEPLFFALTALPSLVGVWLRLRSGSLLLPVIMHSFGNTLSLFV